MMLRGPLIFVLLVAIAVAGTEVQRRLGRRGFRIPAIAGPLWVVIGFVSGEGALGLFPSDSMVMLRGVVLVGLAWIGFVFGMQIDRSVLRRLQPWHRRAGLFLPSAVGAGLAAAGLAIGFSPLTALGLASIGMVSTPESMAAIARMRRPRNRPAVRLTRMVAAFSGIPAMVVFGIASVVWGPSSMAGESWRLLATMLGFGVVTGYAAIVFVRGFNDQLRQLTIVCGITALIAGGSAVLGVSPLPTAVVAGIIVINRSVFPHRTLRAAHSIERPLVVAMFVLVGAATPGIGFAWPVFVILSGARMLFLLLGGRRLATCSAEHGAAVSTPWIGMGLLPQGALALGIAVALVGIEPAAVGILEAAIGAMIVNQVVGEVWIRRTLFHGSQAPESKP